MSVLSQFGSGAIKSIQRGLSLLGGSSSISITVTAVNTAKSKLAHLGHTSAGTTALGAANSFEPGTPVTITLTNSTTITAHQYYSAGGNCEVSWELTEYY